ncbi:uncharacterized protein LOC129174385 isoform X2 [Dunckerocampus dactyliophorus]|uniref:uncharacterized protein LOC129174385 isoform X2 n=1 Tax=Dunckerocampus dactyliophorus TaxID=161453 RepID=UPI002406CE75|nr:uncharacterized protein LOC129174385 isoform X2 [Dunckerocampus dactyliophorus]
MTKDEHGPTLHHTSYSAGIPKVMYEGCGMMTLHLNASPTSTTECFMVEGLSNCNQLGPDTTGGSTYGSFVVGAASGRRHTRQQMRTFPTIQPLSYGVLEKTNVVRPLRHNHVHQQGELQPFGLSKMVPHGHGWRPFTLRPKVNYPDCNLLTLKDNLKSHSYPDPMVGAPRPFLHRISELSCLEGETARLEKMKKTRQPRKSSSS